MFSEIPHTIPQNPKHRGDYYPLGLQIPDRVFASGSLTREGFTGHELDPETGDYYAGARYYLPELGRWASVDPLADEYPSYSPYNYALNNPLSLIDADGRDPIFPSKTTANEVTADLNRVFSRTFGTDQSAFLITAGPTTREVAKSGILNEMFGRTEQVEGYVIVANPAFDFSGGDATETQRSYAASLVEAVGSSHHFVVRESANGEGEGIASGPLRPRMEDGANVGGQVPNRNTVLLAPGLSQDGDPGTGSGGGTWTYAGTFMHEVLYHLHTRGITDGDPRTMQRAFGFTLSGPHRPGRHQGIPTEEDLRDD